MRYERKDLIFGIFGPTKGNNPERFPVQGGKKSSAGSFMFEGKVGNQSSTHYV